MKFLISILIITIITSCSVKQEEKTKNETRKNESLSEEIDSDGDLISDIDEKGVGRNPKIANIPKIRIRFLQNYKISVFYTDLRTKKEGSFVIDTKIGGNSPHFKYRIGNLFLRDSSYKSAATIGKFSGHSHGEHFDHDLSWVKYPEIDEKFFQEKVLLYSKYFNEDFYEITNVKIQLENSIKLKENTSFNEVSDIELSFRFYNYETENYEIIHSQKLDKIFIAGVNEIVTVKVDNVNPKLISENFFKKGEFIISELTNYEIPSLKTDYKALLKSVKEKSIPVVLNTPLETNVSYIAINKGISFNKALLELFDKNYVIKNDQLESINQFKNNLKDYTYLSEVKNQGKKGKWFVFTNRLNKHFLDHEYQRGDVISLSYILGHELSSQTEESVFNYIKSLETTNRHQKYIFGNITPNSEIKFYIKPLKISGETLKQTDGKLGNKDAKCYISINDFRPLNKRFKFRKDLKEEISRIELLINGSNYKLIDLAKKKKIQISWEKLGIAIKISDINKIHKIYPTEENVIGLKLSAYRKNHFNGVKLTKMKGRFKYFCPRHIVRFAGENKLPVSVESSKFSEWAKAVNWKVIKRGERREHIKMFSVSVTGVVKNYYN